MVFSEVHPRDDLNASFEEIIENIAVKSLLVNVNFTRAAPKKKPGFVTKSPNETAASQLMRFDSRKGA